MGMPELVVTAVLVEGRTKSEVARDYGVCRRWVITFVQRYLAAGEAGLVARSRRPHTSPSRTPGVIEDEIVTIRKELDRHGHEAGAATIAFHLQQRHGAAPGGQHDLADPDRPRLRDPATTQAAQELLPALRRRTTQRTLGQTDITHWALADGTDVEILNWLDDHSRLLLASTTQRVFKAPDVDACFRKIAARQGNPASVLSDNGAVFTGRFRRGRVALEVTLHGRGIVFIHSRPYHPQTCGKVERFHQTVKKHGSATQPRARTMRELQRQLDTFRGYYNTVRPHRALHRQARSRPTKPAPKPHPPAPH